MFKRIVLCLALLDSPAYAQQAASSALDYPAVYQTQTTGRSYPKNDGTTGQAQVVANYEPTYQVLGTKGGAGASATGPYVGPVYGASYIFACSGTLAGATIQLQVLGPDGVTPINVAGASFTTLPAATGVTLGSTQGTTTPNVRASITGATGTPSVYCNLS